MNAPIALATKHVDNGARMASSAAVCLGSARELLADGKAEYAARWAVQSLCYSVGIFHPDRRLAGEILGCGERSPFNADFIRDRV
jgi:hypothetical protein